jgi:hypothetical protein
MLAAEPCWQTAAWQPGRSPAAACSAPGNYQHRLPNVVRLGSLLPQDARTLVRSKSVSDTTSSWSGGRLCKDSACVAPCRGPDVRWQHRHWRRVRPAERYACRPLQVSLYRPADLLGQRAAAWIAVSCTAGPQTAWTGLSSLVRWHPLIAAFVGQQLNSCGNSA